MDSGVAFPPRDRGAREWRSEHQGHALHPQLNGAPRNNSCRDTGQRLQPPECITGLDYSGPLFPRCTVHSQSTGRMKRPLLPAALAQQRAVNTHTTEPAALTVCMYRVAGRRSPLSQRPEEHSCTSIARWCNAADILGTLSVSEHTITSSIQPTSGCDSVYASVCVCV